MISFKALSAEVTKIDIKSKYSFILTLLNAISAFSNALNKACLCLELDIIRLSVSIFPLKNSSFMVSFKSLNPISSLADILIMFSKLLITFSSILHSKSILFNITTHFLSPTESIISLSSSSNSLEESSTNNTKSAS